MDKRLSILITGIAGTLGTAFTDLLKDDHDVVGIDHNEASVTAFKTRFPDVPVECENFAQALLTDIDLVIHLAAMKHIDLCEISAAACVNNNVIKTWLLFDHARYSGTDVLFMSTDKAVEPTSMYGFSKALMEGVCRERGWAFARSGNILASNGSVLAVWDEALAAGRPIKLTHKDMRRFFIDPDNLAKRIWSAYQAGIKEIIPEMDRDIGLMDLLIEKLAVYGHTPHNYPGGIEYIGLRPGEKLVERLTWPE